MPSVVDGYGYTRLMHVLLYVSAQISVLLYLQVPELRLMLKNKGLSSNGRKAALVERLQSCGADGRLH